MSKEGCLDITNKITNSIYGRFLPQASKILLYENKLVGFCLANITSGGIANLPLIGIKAAISDVIKLNQSGIIELSELNASLDLNLPSALKMYQSAGFKESYRYYQAYLPKGWI